MVKGDEWRHVSFAHYLPFEGIPHAGGEYVRRHCMTVARSVRCHLLIGEDFTGGREASEFVSDNLQVTLVPRPRWGHLLAFRAWRRLARTVNPFSIGADQVWAFHRSRRVREALEAADSVEFQFTEQASLFRLAARYVPRSRCVAVVHDVVSQRYERRYGDSPSVLQRAHLRFIRWQERRLLGRFATISVFSGKDRRLLESLGVEARVEVLNVPLTDPEMLAGRAPTKQAEVLFVGAWSRPENADGAQWLLEEVWPRVQSMRPDARLVLAGASPTTGMSTAAAGMSSVQVTGYVSDLSALYRRATLVIVPLRQGAGVKFKTITAMLWGVPVVATTVGAEGIPRAEEFLLIADDAQAFADAVCEGLSGRTSDLSAAGQEWALLAYGDEAFADSLAGLFGYKLSKTDGQAPS